jgi:hypothetical protein
MAKRKSRRPETAEPEVNNDPPKVENFEIVDNSEVVEPPAATVDADVSGVEPYEAPIAQDPNEYRAAPRASVHVKAVVQFRESEENTWKEIVDITTISKNGAALPLSNPCPIGRIVSIALQMPTELRLYDFTQDIYAMLGVVQNCSPMTIEGKTYYHVGVAFIGKKMPDSFKADPSQSYRITGRTPLGLWQVEESSRQFKSRRAARFWRRFEVALSVRDEARRETIREKAFIRDISVGGMSVWGPVNARIGDRVKVTSRDYDFYSMAIVRNRTDDPEPERSMVHFEFDGSEFPIEKVDLPKNDTDVSEMAEV